MKKTQFHVGGIEEFGDRFIDAWKRAEAGEEVNERHHSFETWELMTKTLSSKRLEMLRYLKTHSVVSIKKLSEEIHRDYRRVHEDVKILQGVGLIDDQLHVLVDRVQTELVI